MEQRRPGNFNRDRRSGPQEPSEFYEKVVQVNRVSKKTKGGDKRSLSVIVVVGDRKGKVGVGLGKAADVQSAVRKATSYAKKHLIEVPLKNGRTIPHDLFVKLGAAKVLMKPAPEGTGVIAGGAVRVVVEAAGVRDIVSKTLGTSNQASNVYATLHGLKQLKPLTEGMKQAIVKDEEKAAAKKVEAAKKQDAKEKSKNAAK
jgi:small subunit ribosomal protein S5